MRLASAMIIPSPGSRQGSLGTTDLESARLELEDRLVEAISDTEALSAGFPQIIWIPGVQVGQDACSNNP